MISGGGIAVPLPPPRTATSKPRIAVAIASKGEIFVGPTRVADAALPRTLRDLASRYTDPELVIKADRNAPYARVVVVLDAAKQAGLTRISLEVAPAP